LQDQLIHKKCVQGFGRQNKTSEAPKRPLVLDEGITLNYVFKEID